MVTLWLIFIVINPQVVEALDEPTTVGSLNDVSPPPGNGMINRAATEVFGQNPLNDVAGRNSLNDVPTTRDSILSDVARRKAEREREERSQMERLKSLNSPLPTPKKVTDARSRGPRKTNFQPQIPVSATRSQTPNQSLNDLTKTIQNSVVESKATAAKGEKTGKKSMSSFANPFARLTGPRKTPAPSPLSTPPAAAPRTPPPPTRAAPAKRSGPIRMELPLGGEEDEDEEGTMTEGMTIGEIMKRQQSSSSADQGARSKQWGVDMSRFKD